MALTQESILTTLVAEGGRVKKSELVGRFRDEVDCVDAAQKERNRELFKTFVNNVAFVKEIDGVRCVVLKKAYQHLLESVQPAQSHEEKAENMEQTGEQSPQTESCEGAGGERSADQQQECDGESPTEFLSPIELALQRSKFTNMSVKRILSFDVQKQDTSGDVCLRSVEPTTSIQSKPYALPLRMPTSATRVEVRKLKVDPDEPPEGQRYKRGLPPVERGDSSICSPQLRKSVKSTKVSEETKDARISSMVPLEQSEHEWLVKCAAGHWTQAYGLLLRDSQLAEKRDFMSGFTALHWAAKCGNSDMLVKIIDQSRQGGVDVDINVKTHGGYTPLHIAALHNQQYIMAILVNEFGASIDIRDNCGKRPYHYLHEGTSETVREMLGEPKEQQPQDSILSEKEELELFPDLSKGLHSISRLFQPNVTGLKKKHKQRPGLYSLSDDPSEERQDSSFRHRAVSEAFM